MSSYASTPYQGTGYVPDGVPLDLLARGLQGAQQETDAFKSSIQGPIDNISSSPIYRDADRAVIQGKLKSVVGQLNSYAGQDLTDGKVANDISNLASGLSNDPDVVDRIMANRQRGQEVQKLQSIKRDHPELYNPVNEQDFMAQDQAWLNDPSKINYNAHYQPYRNYPKWMDDNTKEILKDPDVINETHYTTDPLTGKRIVRDQQEVKEVTADRIFKELTGTIPADMDSQMQLEYSNAMRTHGPQIALATANDDAQKAVAKAAELKSAVESAKTNRTTDPTILAQAQARADKADQDASNAIDLRDRVASGEVAPGDYLPYDRYKGEKLWHYAMGQAYRKEGSTTIDPIYLARLKHMDDQEDIRTTARLKNATPDTPPDTLNDYTAFTNEIFSSRGKAAINKDVWGPLNNLSSGFDKDGFATKTFNGQTAFVDLRPLLGDLATGEDIKTNAGHTILNDGFNVWAHQQIQANQLQQSFTQPDSLGLQWPTGGSGPTMGPGAISGHTPHGNVTMTEYIQHLKSEGLAGTFKKDYGIDLDDPTSVTKAVKIHDKLVQVGMDNVGNQLSALHGSIRVTPGSGDNVFRASDGSPYTSGVHEGTEQEWAALLGPDRVSIYAKAKGADGVPLLHQVGTTNEQQGKNKVVVPVYQMTMSTSSPIDLQVGYDQYLRTTKSTGDYKDNAQAQKKAYADDLQTHIYLSHLSKDDYKAYGDEIVKADPTQKENIINLINTMDAPQASATTQKKCKAAIVQMYQHIKKG